MAIVVIIPACTVPASRSHDGLDHILPEQSIASPTQARSCVWCAVEFYPPKPAKRQALCSRRCAARKQKIDSPSQLGEVVMEQVGRLTPRMSHEVHRRVVEVWGEVTIRAVLRCLSRFVEDGRIIRTPDGYLLARTPRYTAAGVAP